ncbi:MAG: ribosome assembly factor SBDS [Candidatus Woesearchaeota archaeon]
MAGLTFDPEKFQLTIARLKKGGEVFEIVVDPDCALAYKDKTQQDISDVLKAHDIFCDAQRGQLASDSKVKELFGTNDVDKVAHNIITEGELHLTTEYKKKLREQKLRGIITYLHQNSMDPRTKLPHPPQRIETALQEAKVRIDEFAPIAQQAKDMLKKLQHILPISIEQKEVTLHFSAQHAGKAIGVLQRITTVLQQQWDNDGSLHITCRFPAGMEASVYEQVKKFG